MNITHIPFVQTVGLSKTDDDLLQLEMTHSVYNHLNTIAASAQFTLAETASGQLLIESFPDLVGKVVPVLRDSTIKFKRPAESTVKAKASVTLEASDALLEQLERRGRGTIEIKVDVVDASDKGTCVATFNWYIQVIPEA